ncbi:MAG: carbohydrate-binding family 9-like protein [Labilithrix sp.]|nr:carbohydrate-binding family 9-like protein [Labilithrix sp.]MCW5816194.1 carbohydrate-binding family 9-like protein [Labilithrix sp.]
MKASSIVLLVLLAAGCVGGKQQISAEDKAKLAANILDAVPPDAKKTDVNFENKVHLVGYKIEPEIAGPGAQVKATYYWRCDEPLEEGWRLFTHLQHEGFDRHEGLDGVGPLREARGNSQVLGPDRWERGKIYADEQTFTMPKELKGPDSLLYVGIFKGDARLTIRSGPNDGDNRAIVAKLKTGIAPKPEQKRGVNDVPELDVMKLGANEKIVIDGNGNDKAWGGAASTGPFVDVGTGKPNTSFPINGSAKLLYDDENLYVLITVSDPDVVGYFTTKEEQPKDWTAGGQPMTWNRHTAEIMIDPDGDGDNVNYYEIQINPQNKVFKSQFDGYNKPKVEPQGPFGHEDWDPKMKTQVVVKGTIDNPADKDEGYTVEAQIPWKAFEKGAKELPPKPGGTWRFNFYAMANNGGVAWSPILGQGNFHKASRFGRVRWVTKDFLALGADAGAGDAGLADAGAAKADAGATVKDAGK